ncbi:Ion transport protein-domain-containing protein [Lineolata rhizophorae]|uniref:Calcium-channel protein CCH1 n=1 Tax=Lineolata rhizophorae TaxID=578093 RepID=A0A6A6PA20_9PEZI|nr:Ion transport protein-domain-containing protein [Lineolata rhizophorae]
MDSDDPYSHRRDRSTPQGIPLQDLNSPPDEGESADSHWQQRGALHRRTLSDRGRDLLRNRESLTGRPGTRYAPIAETSPSPTRAGFERSAGAGQAQHPPRLQTGGFGAPHQDAPDISPLDDLGAFQQAIGGFAGLSFQGESSSETDLHREPSYTSASMVSGVAPLQRSESESTQDWEDPDRSNFSPVYTDTAPLTDRGHLQPMGVAEPTTPTGLQPGDRSSFQTVRFLSPETRSPAASRLGDDLPTVEANIGSLSPSDERGLERSGSRMRSLSPGGSSPLRRAGTIVRNMSQRVVNLSNEPELVERSIQRKSSHKQSRLEQPPSFPALSDYAHDGAPSTARPPEKPTAPKGPTPPPPPPPMLDWKIHNNPFRGKSLGIFPYDSRLRLRLCDLLVHPVTEPLILVLIVIQTILLTVDSAQDVATHPRPQRFGGSWIDYCLFGLFVIYTIEIIVRVIVSGFIVNPIEYSTINRQIGLRQAIIDKANTFLAPQRAASLKRSASTQQHVQPSILRSFTSHPGLEKVPGGSRQQQRVRLAHRAFLRHSFNRLDFVAVVSFWVSFVISVFGIQSREHLYIFRMLSCLRILRLLSMTSGTTVILRSLKKAAPLLVNVAFLLGFFWLLFAVVGVQTFKSSLRRTCVWRDPEGVLDDFVNDFQFCGGYIGADGQHRPWLKADGITAGTSSPKGFLCPPESRCIEGDNPYNGTVSYDNILQSLQQVFVIMSSNTFSEIMYYLMDSEYLAGALFFALAIIIMSLWLISLLIAVITSSFNVIRDESKASAFTAEEKKETLLDEDQEKTKKLPKNTLKYLFNKTRWIWITIICYGLLCQSLRSAEMSDWRMKFLDASETAVTLALDVEIVLRIAVDWRNFFKGKQNLVDLFLAVITTIIQIPPIHNSGEPYAWLTIFQIIRIYRVVLAVPLTRDLIMVVLGNVSGILNLILFVALLTFLAAIFASQLFRGELPPDDGEEALPVTFKTIYNSFLGMYQIFSSEDWTSIMYSITTIEVFYGQAWIGAAFFIMWFILANFIVLNMFIAVIQENFDVSEDEKRLQQVKAFLQQKEMGGSSHGNLSLSTIFKLSQATGRRKDPLDYGPAATEMLLKDAVVRDFLDDQGDQSPERPNPEVDPNAALGPAPTTIVSSGIMSTLYTKFMRIFRHTEPNPFYSRLQISRAYEDLDPRRMAKEVVSATEKRKLEQREYLRKHPNYNVSLFIFKPHNPIRKICQRIVGPGRGGDRIEGVAPSVPVWYAFSAFLYAAIVAMVILACVTTPLYQKEYFTTNEFSVKNWFVFTDMGFAILFTVEAIIKVIADGFFWTPNAYFRGSWGFIDGIVLITLWINVGASLLNEGEVSRVVGAFKALRALRLLNVSDSARDTFHSIIVRGGWKILSAAFVSLSLLIPFAIYGLNLFNGKMQACNDGNSNISDLRDCVGEYFNQPYDWDVLSPRVASNPYFDFDNFGGSAFILFQIVSQEGWIDVMWAAESITGVFRQPQPFASEGNAVFFVVYNLLGAVFVLTLFVSVFMRNYTEQTGVAFLTTDQRSWLELRKLLRQISPSKRPSSSKKRETWEEWCYRRAVSKRGRWQRFITLVLVLHLILLCLEFYPSVFWWDRTRDYIFLVFTLIYIVNIGIRIVGLTWSRFRKSSWDVYSILAVSGTFITTILLLSNFKQRIYIQAHKLFLVLIALLLIPRNNQLDQLFKTAAASFTKIANLLATWGVLFLVYAIALTQTFGLTKFNTNETGNLNFRTVPKALILLFRTSVGEGWNELMEDFATVQPPFCTMSDKFLDSDCGSPEWARALFISWNILSMYIFVNLFISLIYESFSYVYQRSSGLSVISREEIRRFKQAWAEFDPNGTSFITKEQFPRLLGELSGIFEMRIYDGDFTVRRLVEDCSVRQRESQLPVEGAKAPVEVDLKKLRERLRDLPVEEIRRRRTRMNVFYEEVLVSADPDRGINFTALLMILAHYKVINDNKSLRYVFIYLERHRASARPSALSSTVSVALPECSGTGSVIDAVPRQNG